MNRNVVATYGHEIHTLSQPEDSSSEHGLYKFYVIQEYCNGGSLSEAVAEGCFAAGALKRRWQGILSLLKDIAEGMDYIHSCRICHGDLSPSHILLKVRRLFSGCLLMSCFLCSCLSGRRRGLLLSAAFATSLRVWKAALLNRTRLLGLLCCCFVAEHFSERKQ